jgi:hypothetical protein
LNLYLDAVRRSDELTQLDIDIDAQKTLLGELCETGVPTDDIESLRRHCRYFKTGYRQDTAIIESYELDDRKVARTKKVSGFSPSRRTGVTIARWRPITPTGFTTSRRSTSSR